MSKKLPSSFSFLLYPCPFLMIQPDGMVKFAHERADDYVGITVEWTLIADGRFT